MPIFKKKTKKIPFNNFKNIQNSNKDYTINDFIKTHKPIPMLKNLIQELQITTNDVDFFTDTNVEPSDMMGLTITSNTSNKNKFTKIATNRIVSLPEVKKKLNNATKRFKIGVLQIYPGKKASRYLKVIGHVNLIIIDSKEKHIFHYEPKKKGFMLSIEKKFRYQMGQNEIINRLNILSKSNNNNNNNNNNKYSDYTYHKFYGNQPSFNKYCMLYIVYAALKFAKNIKTYNSLFHKNTAILAPVHSLIYNESINNYYTQLFKSIKQKDVRNLLIYYKKKFPLESLSSTDDGNNGNSGNNSYLWDNSF
jgi:hypothetical protein